MAMPGVSRDDLDIPDRPIATSRGGGNGFARWRPFLYGAAGAGAVLVVAAVGMSLLNKGDRIAGGGDVPLIKPEESPIKVSPDAPGGMNVPNRGLLVYEHMQKQPDTKHPAGKPPVERLLPDPEEPMQPPRVLPKASDELPPLQPVAPTTHATDPLPPPESSAGDRRSLDQLIASLPPEEPVPAPALSVVKPTPVEKKPAAEKPATSAMLAQPKVLPPAEVRKPAPASVVPAEKAASTSKGGYVVQLFAGRSAQEAETAWTKIRSRNGDLLGSLASSVARADLGDRGTFYRLRAGPFESEAKAKALCSALSSRGQSCIIVRGGA